MKEGKLEPCIPQSLSDHETTKHWENDWVMLQTNLLNNSRIR